MHEAISVLSRKGLFVERLTAFDVRSREHARKLWPLVTVAPPYRLVTWVKPSFDSSGNLRTRSHFRRLNHASRRKVDVLGWAEGQEGQRRNGEGQRHKRAKRLIFDELEARRQKGLGLPWSFQDPSVSDFHFSGSLTTGVSETVMEHPIEPIPGLRYRLDIALLGEPVASQPMIMGGIEIEDTHAFDGLKGLVSKFLAFPVVSIDISEMSDEDLTPQWAATVLSSTTASDPDGKRKTYFNIHELLYPLFWQYPDVLSDENQQLLVFGSDEELQRLQKWVNILGKKLSLDSRTVSASILNAKNPVSAQALMTAGEVIGPDWRDYNEHRFLRIVLKRPEGLPSPDMYRLYMTIARLLINHSNVCVGYQYERAIYNTRPYEDIWKHETWNKGQKTSSRLLPKRLSDPRDRILSVVNEVIGESSAT